MLTTLGDSLLLGNDLRQLVDQALEPHRSGRLNILLMHGITFGNRPLSAEFLSTCLARHGRVWPFELGHAQTDTAHVTEGVQRIQALGIDLIVALGGGRVMDIAKVCATFRDFDFSTDLEAVLGERHSLIPKRKVALVAIPTTPGTGSEATPYAVLTGRGNRKLVALSPHLKPDAGIVFPPFYTTVPADVTRQSLMDGFTHALEALWSRRATSASDEYAIRALELFGHAMIPFYRNPRDLELAKSVATAAAYGGLAFGMAYTSLCHALSFPLAERLRLGHGQCCALTAVQVAAFNSDYETPALKQGAAVLGLSGVDDLPGFIRHLRDDLEDRATLSSYGITSQRLPDIAGSAKIDMVSNNAKRTEADDLVSILRAAL